MRLINPRGHIVSVREPLASYYASRDGWQVLETTETPAPEPVTQPDLKPSSSTYTVREATEMASTMTAEQIADFVQGDTRKSIQKLL